MALLVHIRLDGTDWKIEAVHRFDLRDRGVRDLARDGDDILILAGPVDEESLFALYRWDGVGTPSAIPTDAFDGIRPEALVKIGDRWLALSDDGNIERDGKDTCNDIRKQDRHDPKVYFRGRAFTF